MLRQYCKGGSTFDEISKKTGKSKHEVKKEVYNSDYYKLIKRISNNYQNFSVFVKLFNNRNNNKDKNVIEKIDDIHYRMKYQPGQKIIKPAPHIGQRKLLLNEIQFLNKVNEEICVYVGAAPGNKTHYLSNLFPKIKFILIDPNKFDLFNPSNNKSHRREKHKDIVHIYNHYPTNSNTYCDNKKISEMNKKEKTNLISFIKNSNYKIFIIEDYMDITHANFIKSLSMDLSFISDVRSNSSNSGSPLDADIYWNTSMMYNWITIIKPVKSMLKIRMPYGSDKDKKIINNKEFKPDFMLSKKNGIDFPKNYMNNEFYMSKSELFIQPWAGISSTELRMYINKNDINNIIKYNVELIEDKFYYYNSINRSWVCHSNNNADKSLHFCYCNDCALENKILTEYNKNNVKNMVKQINIITGRHLSVHHKIPIWKNVSEDIDLFTLMVKKSVDEREDVVKKESQKMSRYTKHRGDFGKE